jgi:hypothetical protein
MSSSSDNSDNNLSNLIKSKKNKKCISSDLINKEIDELREDILNLLSLVQEQDKEIKCLKEQTINNQIVVDKNQNGDIDKIKNDIIILKNTVKCLHKR